jgi:hypothetical protein
MLNSIPTGVGLASPPCPTYKPPEGAVFKGPGPEVYVFRSGLKRHIPNGFTFNVMKVNWANVDTIAASLVSGVPTGNPILSATTTGILVKGSGPAVYVMHNGQKRHVTSPDVMTACGYSSAAVLVVADGSLSSLPTGSALTAAPCPTFAPATGTLLQGTGPEVWIARQGLKRHIPNGATLDGMGYKMANLNFVNDYYLSAMPTGKPVFNLLANGQLVKGPGAEVFVMQDGARRHVANGGVFAACGYRWDAIYEFSASRLSSIPAGLALTGAPCPMVAPSGGVLMQGTGLEVFTSEAGMKRHVTTESVLTSCGYQWGNVDRLKDGLIASIPSGAPLTVPPCP